MFENRIFKTIIFWMISHQPFYEKLCVHIFKYFDVLWFVLYEKLFQKSDASLKKRRYQFLKCIQKTSSEKYAQLHKLNILESTLCEKKNTNGSVVVSFAIEDYLQASVWYIFLLYCQIRNQVFNEQCENIQIQRMDVTSFVRQFVIEIEKHESFRFVFLLFFF